MGPLTILANGWIQISEAATIGYIVDFVCLERRIIIELDGGQHAEQHEYDNARDVWLRDQGFTILRFWNHDVLQNTEGVKQEIFKTLQSTPFLSPSPQGGRRRSSKKSHLSHGQ
jgi:very-short-patch-repair endonuclease